MLTLAPLILARDCFRADAVGPPATETAATTWSLADCTTLDFSCTSSNSSAPAAESGKLCDNALQVDEVASLTEALKSEAPNLVSLELRGNWVGPLKGAALATALQAHPSLEFLGLASTALGDVGGTALARRLLLQEAPPALRRVDLSHNHLGDDCARALAESLKAEDGLPAWSNRRLGSATALRPCLLRLARLAPAGTTHSRGATVPLSTQWEAAARATAASMVADCRLLTLQACRSPRSISAGTASGRGAGGTSATRSR